MSAQLNGRSLQPWLWDLSLDLRAQSSGTIEPAVGLRLGGGTTFGGFVELNAALPRSLALGEGTISWNRFGLGLGAKYRPAWNRVLLEPAVSVEGAVLWARSAGYRANTSVVTADVAVCAQLRAGVRFNDLFVFSGLRGCAWPIATRAEVTGVSGAATVPSFEGALSLGVGFDLHGASSAP